MIRLKDVEMEYDNGTRAIKGITLTIEDGEFVFLVGPSGSGKSTIIKLLTGEVEPCAGRIMINGFSKSHAMTGWRLGYAAAPDLILKQMLKILQYAIMCAPTTSQYAAVSALKNGDPDVEMMRESYDQRRRFLLNAFREMGIDCFEPLGAFYTFPNISRFGMTSEEFATKLLMEEKVAVVPGTAFGACGEGFVRISYAYSLKSLKEALSRIERFVKRHDGKAE